MASVQSNAITKELAYKSLKNTTQVIAEKLGIDPPELDIHKRYDLEYRNAQELSRIAKFLEEITEKLEPVKVASPRKKTVTKGGKNA